MGLGRGGEGREGRGGEGREGRGGVEYKERILGFRGR